MATIELISKGQLRTEATHVQSGNKLMTDAPTDNNGKGEYFSPTDLVATALGSCMLTLLDMTAARSDIDITGTRVEITKIMYSAPRRIGEIKLDFYMPTDYDHKHKLVLERAAATCPVAKSLDPDMIQTVTFHYKS